MTELKAKNLEFRDKNNELLEIIRTGGKQEVHEDKIIRVDNYIPEVYERVNKVERIVDDDVQNIGYLTEQEKKLVRDEVKKEYKLKIKELEDNILAY